MNASTEQGRLANLPCYQETTQYKLSPLVIKDFYDKIVKEKQQVSDVCVTLQQLARWLIENSPDAFL